MDRSMSGVAKGVVCLALVAPLLSGCIATRNWVREQVSPIDSRLGVVEGGLMTTQADVARLNSALANLHLQRSLVLDMKDGANFSFDSASLTANAKGEIDRFLNEMKEREMNEGRASPHVFVVAGHTDSAGDEGYNYQLGQRRASAVSGYLLTAKEVDPLAVHAVSYGEAKPVAENSNLDGRRRNRRVEILVYGERVAY